MNDQPDLFADEYIPPPCLRIPFKRFYSWNDAIAAAANPRVFRGWLDDWLNKARTRAAEVLEAEGVKLLHHREVKYGKQKVSEKTGNLLKRTERVIEYRYAAAPFFNEPVGCIARLWRPTALDYDIINLAIKPVFDGFVNCKVIKDDSFKYLPEFGFRFHGIDRSLNFTADERLDRRAFQQARVDAGKNKKKLQMRIRLLFDFYRLSRIEGGSIFGFKLKA